MAVLREIRNLHEPNPSKMKTFRYVFVRKISPWSFRGKMPPKIIFPQNMPSLLLTEMKY